MANVPGEPRREPLTAAERSKRYRARKRAELDAAARQPRGYSWPPFEPGNAAAVTHGAYSPARVDPLADALITDLLAGESPEYLKVPVFRAAVSAWAQLEAKSRVVAEYLASLTVEQWITPRKGTQTPPIDTWRRLMVTTMHARQRLGIDPLSRGKLGRDIRQVGQADVALRFAELQAQGVTAGRDPRDGWEEAGDDDD